MKQTTSSILPYWSKDLVAIVNGRHVYKPDILDDKRKIQRRRLARIRAKGNEVRPCFIWVFHNVYKVLSEYVKQQAWRGR